MRGGLGGLLGETWQGYVNKAGEDANKGAARFQRGMSEAEKIRKENVDQFTAARKSGLNAGAPPKQATHSDLAIRAMENLSIANQGSHAPLVARQHQEARVGDQSTANTNPLLEPVHSGHAPRTGRHAPRQIVYTGGKRKTKETKKKKKEKEKNKKKEKTKKAQN